MPRKKINLIDSAFQKIKLIFQTCKYDTYCEQLFNDLNIHINYYSDIECICFPILKTQSSYFSYDFFKNILIDVLKFIIMYRKTTHTFLYDQLSQKCDLVLIKELIKCLNEESIYYLYVDKYNELSNPLKYESTIFIDILKSIKQFEKCLMIHIDNINLQTLKDISKNIKTHMCSQKFRSYEIQSFKWSKIKQNIDILVNRLEPFNILNINQKFSTLDVCNYLNDLMNKELKMSEKLDINNNEHMLIKIEYFKQSKYIKETISNIKKFNIDDESCYEELRKLKNLMLTSYQNIIDVNRDLSLNVLKNKNTCDKYKQSFNIDIRWADIFSSINKYLFYKSQKHKTNPKKHKTLKSALKHVLTNLDNIEYINNIVYTINEVINNAYIFSKGFILHNYETNNWKNIDYTSFDYFSMIIRAITINDPKGNNINEENNKLLKILENFYETHFKTIFKKINVVGFSQILNAEKIKLATSYNNNIMMNYDKYLKYYLKASYLENNKKRYEKAINENKQSEFKKEVNEQINIFMNYINSNFTFKQNIKHDEMFKKFIDENKKNFIPEHIGSNGKNYELKENPNMFFKQMVFMNKELERMKRRTFMCFPMRKSNVPSNIEIDTLTLITLFIGKEKEEKGITKIIKDNLGVFYKKVWNEVFKVDKFKYNEEYLFANRIETNGYELIIHFTNRDLDEINVNVKKIEDVFKSIDDIEDKKELINLANTYEILFVDPGKNPDILFITNYVNKNEKERKYFKYTTKQRIFEMGTLRNRKIIQKIKKEQKITEIENELKEYTLKTCMFEKFKENIKKKEQLNEKLKDFYKQEIFRKINYRAYIDKLRTESKLVNNIKSKFKEKKEIALIYGDWSRKSQMKGCISVPNIGIKLMLAKYFKILNIDEYKTSKIDRYTLKENVNAEVKDVKKSIKKGKEIYKKIHAVLVSKIDEKQKRYQNRNRNSVLNMELIFDTYIKSGKRHEIFSRKKPDM